MSLAPYSIVVGLAVVALGCSSSTADTTTIVRPELVQVSPADFLGMQTCDPSDLGGLETTSADVQAYVATLFDVTPLASGVVPDPGFQLPSSPATLCTLPVTFSNVVSGHVYVAEIDAYDRGVKREDAGLEVVGLEAATPGARIQSLEGNRVSPRWTAKCGGYAQSLVADGGSYVTFGGAPSKSDIAADEASAADEAGAGGEGNLSGVVSYDTITQTLHNCAPGLRAPEN